MRRGSHEGVHGFEIGAVVRIDFLIGRNALLVNENARSYGKRLTHGLLVTDAEDVNDHGGLRTVRG